MLAFDTIHGRIFAHGAERPEAPFVTVIREGGTTLLTYGALARWSAAYAEEYARRGVARGDGIAIVLPQCAELYPAFLGAMAVGAIPAILPVWYPKQNPAIFWQAQQATLARMQAKVLVTEANTQASMPQALLEQPQTLLADEVAQRSDMPPRAQGISGDQVAFLQHSSGTTALKKGVPLRHRAVLAHVDAYAKAICVTPNDRVATWLPLYHDMGLVACFLLPAICGLDIVCLDPFEWVLRPTSLLDAIDAHACTLAWLPNFAFHHVLRTLEKPPAYDLRPLRALIDCSEPCKPETLELFYEALASTGLRREALQVCYAMAENVFAVTQTSLLAPPRVLVVDREILAREGRVMPASEPETALRLLSCGKPIATARVRVVGADGGALPEGHVGQIAVAGETLFAGYHRAEGAPAIRDGWYTTGDLGLLVGAELYITGRAEDVLIINGRNVYAHDVEQAVNANTAVKPGRCLALGVFDAAKGSEELTLVVEASGDEPHTELRRTIAEAISSAIGVAVSRIHFVVPGWLIKTTSGKIARKANFDKLAHETSRERAGELGERKMS